MSQSLRDARRYEEIQEQTILAEDRPAYHLSARVGWMNDPNGFSWYKGQYHLFYQYYPYDSHWGPMHWGHAVSKDLLHWNYYPTALAPDTLYDKDGVYSGNALVTQDGRHILMYTGVYNKVDANGAVRTVQTQNLAFGDGMDYEKYINNPVITEADLPEGGSKYDFRDPKLWQLQDGTYRAMFANNREGNGGGTMLLYKSEDLIHWELVRVFAENNYRIGLMWECPDFFILDGKAILLASTQDMLPQGYEYDSGNGAFYMVGSFDTETESFTEEANYAVDYGIDFYAPQTVITPDGRRVMIAWMQNWDTCNLRTKSVPWYGQMSVPRELRVKNNRLIQTPIREIEQLRIDPVRYDDVVCENGELKLEGIQGRVMDLTVDIRATNPEEVYRKFSIYVAQDDEYYTSISFRPPESKLKINRKFSCSRRAIIHQKRCVINHDKGAFKVRILVDRRSIELFVNDGEQAMSVTIETPNGADGVTFIADGSVTFSVEKYTLDI